MDTTTMTPDWPTFFLGVLVQAVLFGVAWGTIYTRVKHIEERMKDAPTLESNQHLRQLIDQIEQDVLEFRKNFDRRHRWFANSLIRIAMKLNVELPDDGRPFEEE